MTLTNAQITQISVTTRVQSAVGKSQSWVFRAVACDSGSHDVLCLQLPEGAASFVTTYENHRTKILENLANSSSTAANKPLTPRPVRDVSSTATTPSNASTPSTVRPLNIGSDLSKGFRAMGINDTTQLMRRRLSTFGNDPTLDGHAEGARNESVAVPSPTQRSPLKSTPSYAKTLRPTKASPTTSSKLVPLAAPSTLLCFSGISVKGLAPYNPDKQNQDALLMHQLPGGEILLSVFDGHGEQGHKVSQHFKSRVPQLLASSKTFSEQPGSTGAILKRSLHQAEREIVEDVHVDTTLSGSTGVVAVLREEKLHVANVGDSRAILGVKYDPSDIGFQAIDVTQDHKPDLPEEKKRIQEVGGRVFCVRFDDGIDGPARVWLSYADIPGLAMSRSLCDTIAKEAGVVSEPDLYEVDLLPEHRFLVIATDGLWEFMTSQEVVDIVAKYSSPADPEGAVRELVDESAKRWRKNEPVIDDTSICVAFFQ